MNWCILAPPECPTPEVNKEYLLKDAYLSEYATDAEKDAVRTNLNVPDKNTIYTKSETEDVINKIVLKAIDESLESIDKKITWVTSGPVETTVGFMEDNTELPERMSILNVLDKIFYDKGYLNHPIFVGLKPDSEISADSLQDLINSDPTNNKLISMDMNSISINYNFVGENQLMIAIPKEFGILESMSTGLQNFDVDAFTLEILVIDDSVEYIAYIYNQPIITLDQVVIFKIKRHE